MFSLNVPLPPAVGRLADDLHAKRSGFDRVRDRHTLVCKRFGTDDVTAGGEAAGSPPPGPEALARLREDLRPRLAPVDPFAVAITGVDAFETPASGSGPVVYLAVESDGLVRLHRRLCAAYGAIEAIEGDAYVPHVTLARGGEPAVVREVIDGGVAFEPVRWRVHALDLYDPEFREVAATLEL
ncbi:2'-5' RNA ligase superfamily protein [Halorubrum aquaticum]|uniref:2'-5' RNA ligase superfamily protein n=1 Tax=Halorubrum aquaticum TaxID=387340 RepID=A0A1I3ATN5_9EURY|nr:2'-5' RNA ligase family protein [Halorubrum aquaticum]SFH53373.1 2'-5' RNA ligase superfamily protein [Halorubrum aquaticum]